MNETDSILSRLDATHWGRRYSHRDVYRNIGDTVATVADIAGDMALSETTVRGYLRRLVDAGLVVAQPAWRGGPTNYYQADLDGE